MPPVLDTATTLETPEGIQVELHPAGLFARGLAFLIDELIRWGIMSVAFIVAAVTGLLGLGLALIVFFFTYWLYGVTFEVLNNGVTPGKRVQGLQVVHDDGTPIRLPASMLRNLVLYVDLLPAFYTAAIVSMLLTDKFRRLGDLAAGTMVVYRERQEPAAGDAVSGAKPAPLPLTLEEQGVLVDFLERRGTLSAERNQELAGLLVDVLKCRPEAASDEILRIANGLRGGA